MPEPVKPRTFRVKVGKRGEIYTTKEIRELLLTVRDGEVVIKMLPSLSEVLRKKPLLKLSFEKAERMSEEAQRRYGL